MLTITLILQLTLTIHFTKSQQPPSPSPQPSPSPSSSPSSSTSTVTKIFNISAAVQNQNQTYFSYLAFISACNYSQPNMYPGEVRIELLDSGRFYQEVLYQGQLVFWGGVRNGYTIMMLLPEQIAGVYSGQILYNSYIKSLTRPLILYTLNQSNSPNSTNSSSLTFYYTTPTISLQSTTITLNITKIQPIQLTPQCQQVIDNCPDVSQSNFGYIGNDTFLFVCGGTGNGVVFGGGQGGEDGDGDREGDGASWNGTVVDFGGFGLGNYQVATNPAIYSSVNGEQQYYWNAVILVQNLTHQPQLYFFSYNFQTSNYTTLSFHQMQPQISLLINRIWGLQVKKQFSRWMDLYSTFNLSQNADMFPGDVVSVFVSNHQNIFVEYTTKGGANFLCVFDNSGALYWNVTYFGSIVYYGSKAIFIYDRMLQRIYYIEVDRPIYTLDVSSLPLSNTTVDTTYSFPLTIQCQSQPNLFLNYTILWTTPDYPTAYIKTKNTSQIYSTDIIYGFQIKDRYDIIGPDFEIIINSPPTLDVVIVDSSTIVINQTAIGLIDVEVGDGDSFVVLVVTADAVYEVSNRLGKKTLVIQPCGFNQIQGVVKAGDGGYVITNTVGQQCQCTQDFAACRLVTSYDAYSSVAATQDLYGHNSGFYPYLNSMNNTAGFTLGSFSIKRNLYGLIRQNYIVSILQNNTVYLIDLKHKKISDSYYISCEQQNLTNGDIYIREFYDPFLILFCEKGQSLFQFVVRKGQLVPQRVIPLYRFKTRTGPFSFFPAFSFVFIAVDPVIDIYPVPTNCCVLRLDPCEFTVSVIIQIIQASSIIAVSNYRNVDVALFRSSSLSTTQYIIKAYFPNVWVTINQTNHSSVVDYQNLTMIFESDNYNFAASFQIGLVFNLTEINLNLTFNQAEDQPDISNLNLNFNKSDTSYGPLLMGTAVYNLNSYVCGPIFQSIFYRNMSNMTNLQIIQTDVLTKTKKLGNFGIQFLQLINPSKFSVANLTLNDLILAVSVQKMFVYVKVLNDVQLVNISEFELPERRCTYYLLDVLNSTAATLTANCEGINYNFRSPLLTVNYQPGGTGFTYSYQWVVVPLDLRQIYTIVRGNNQSTLVIGIIEGPMNAATGRLYLCDQSECSPLYISTPDTFLLNYAAQLSTNLYIVMSIDYQTIQIFINPQVQPNSQPIPYNYSINYTKFINEPYCSVLKILNISATYSYNVLSCQDYYYYVRIQFQLGDVVVLRKFVRYSQCNVQDQFKPSALWNQTGLQVLFAQCRQNQYVIRLQTYETINSSSPIIYTGYLQVFTMTGPQGPNCSKQSVSASKIIPLSASMGYPLFMQYSIINPNGNITHKFIYSQIAGILIDNIVTLQPSLTVQYQPLVLQYTFPQIQFYAINPFHHIQQKISTTEPDNNSATAMNILAFVLFAISNLITIVCLVCFMCQRGQREAILRMQQGRDSTAIGAVEELEYDDSFRNMGEVVVNRDREVTGNLRKNTKRPSQIQMFFVKKK